MTIMSKQKTSPGSFHEGTTHVDEDLKRLVDPNGPACDVVLRKITIYKTPIRHDLQSRAEELIRQLGAGASTNSLRVHHHFLIVEVSQGWHPEYGDLRGLKIRAEKSGPDPQSKGSAGKTDPRRKESAGIKVKIVPIIREGKDAVVHYSVDIPDRLTIPLKKLVEILTKPNPDYDLLRDNCWKYADTTYEAVVKYHLVNSGEGEYERLADNLRKMPPLVMPIDIIEVGLMLLVGCC